MGTWTPSQVLKETRECAARYKKSIEAEDDHGAIIRGVIYIDHALRSLLSHRISRPKAIRLDRASSSQLVSLSYALGLIEEPLRKSLESLLKVRNRFAHMFEYELLPTDVSDIAASFDEEVLEFFDEEKHRQDSLEGRLRATIFALCKAVETAEMSLMCWDNPEEDEMRRMGDHIAELQKQLADR